MSNTITVPIAQGTTYTIYTSEEPTTTSTEYTFGPNAKGYVIAESSTGTNITKIGSVQDCVEISDRRHVEYDSTSDCTVNGISVTQGGFVWLEQLDTFVQANGNSVTIDMATNGYYCVNYEALFLFKDIRLNSPITIQTDQNGLRYFTAPSGLHSIFHGGRAETVGNMLVLIDGNLLIDRNARVCELFYIKIIRKDKISFTNVEMSELVIPTASIASSFSGVCNLLAGFRASLTDSMPSVDNTMSSVDLSVTRYNEESTSVTIQLLWLSQLQLGVYDLYLECKHRKQETAIDFSDPKYQLVSVNDDKPQIVDFMQWYTSLPCTFNDGSEGTIIVYREKLPYIDIPGPTVRVERGKTLDPLTSSGVYMVDDNVYDGPRNEVTFESTFDGSTLTITPYRGMKGYSLYDEEQGTWTNTRILTAITFDATYRMAIFTTGKTSVDLSIFGNYDDVDSFTYLDPKGKEIQKGVYTFKAQSNITSGTVIDTVTFTAKGNSVSNTFTVTFVYEDLNRVSFILPGTEGFNDPQRKGSFRGGSDPFWMYGSLIAQIGDSICAYKSRVSVDSERSGIYPIVRFDSGVATIIDTEDSIPVQATIISEDMKIAGSDTALVRLNPCVGMKYESGSWTVPKSIGTCFFRIDNAIYLMRSQPALVRRCSFADGDVQSVGEAGANLSRRGSIRSTSEPTRMTAPMAVRQRRSSILSPIAAIPVDSSTVLTATAVSIDSNTALTPTVVTDSNSDDVGAEPPSTAAPSISSAQATGMRRLSTHTMRSITQPSATPAPVSATPAQSVAIVAPVDTTPVSVGASMAPVGASMAPISASIAPIGASMAPIGLTQPELVTSTHSKLRRMSTQPMVASTLTAAPATAASVPAATGARFEPRRINAQAAASTSTATDTHSRPRRIDVQPTVASAPVAANTQSVTTGALTEPPSPTAPAMTHMRRLISRTPLASNVSATAGTSTVQPVVTPVSVIAPVSTTSVAPVSTTSVAPVSTVTVQPAATVAPISATSVSVDATPVLISTIPAPVSTSGVTVSVPTPTTIQSIPSRPRTGNHTLSRTGASSATTSTRAPPTAQARTRVSATNASTVVPVASPVPVSRSQIVRGTALARKNNRLRT